MATLPIITPFAICLAIPPNHGRTAENIARYSGMILQLLGIGTVAYGLRAARQQFNRRTVFGAVVAWFSERPRLFQPTYVGTASATLVGLARLEGHARVKAGPSSSIEHRLELLEQDVSDLYAQLGAVRINTRENQAALRDERTNRENADIELQKRLETAIVGGLHVNMMGVWWLFVGVVFGTIPDHIALVLAWIRAVVGLG